MKERSLLYFLTAVILSTLLLISVLVRLFDWYPRYGNIVTPSFWLYLIPLLLIWIGWFFGSKGLLLASSILMTSLLIGHAGNIGILSGTPYVLSMYAPMVKTIYVVSLMLLIAIIGLGFYTYWLDEKKG